MSTNMFRKISAKNRHWRHAGTNPYRLYCSEMRRWAAASPPESWKRRGTRPRRQRGESCSRRHGQLAGFFGLSLGAGGHRFQGGRPSTHAPPPVCVCVCRGWDELGGRGQAWTGEPGWKSGGLQDEDSNCAKIRGGTCIQTSEVGVEGLRLEGEQPRHQGERDYGRVRGLGGGGVQHGDGGLWAVAGTTQPGGRGGQIRMVFTPVGGTEASGTLHSTLSS